ncbi:MAG TPA: right-handed parallel beta-helix repeat-containing protein [Planctomycetota bacterium]|nr:right-handed parallel beta-helix repeat-containing protein [Planctomycetota bacterium]
MNQHLGLALVLAAPLFAQKGPLRVADTAALREALAAATPGTEIAVAPGDYDGFAARDVRGTAGAPVVVRAEDAARPPRLRGCLHLSDVAHLTLDGLSCEGSASNGINIDDGGTFGTPSHHVVLRRLAVRDIGGNGNHDGIKLSGVDDFALVDSTVERWGRAGSAVDMVGCHRGTIEGCTFRDCGDDSTANGVQMKGGTCEVAVRRCRFEHAGGRAVQLGGSTGLEYFRPRPAGFEAKDLVVEGCTIVGSQATIAFVGCDGAVVRHNTIVLPRRWVLRILQETRADDFVPCRNGVFTDNLVYQRGLDDVTNIGPDTAPDTFTFARNWWFRADAPSRSLPRLPVAESEPAGGVDPAFRDLARGDLRLSPDSPARRHGADAVEAPRASTAK